MDAAGFSLSSLSSGNRLTSSAVMNAGWLGGCLGREKYCSGMGLYQERGGGCGCCKCVFWDLHHIADEDSWNQRDG